MKLLLVDDEVEILDIISTLIESEIDCEIITAETGNQGVEQLKKSQNFDLILSDYNMPDGNGGVLYNHNRAHDNLPFVFISGGYLEDYDNVKDFYTSNPKNSYIHKPIDFDELLSVIHKAVDGRGESMDSDYCAVPFSLLEIYDASQFNLYLKINDQKFVKLKNEDEDFNDDFGKYKEKGQSGLYLTRDDFKTYMDRLIVEQNKKLLESPSEVSTIEICGENLEVMKESLYTLGLTDEQLSLMSATVESCIDSLGAEPPIQKSLEAFLKSKGYYVSHSLTAAFISYRILCKLGMTQDSIISKLFYASILHDVTLQDSNLCQIYNINGPEYQELPKKDRDKIKNHMLECANLLEDCASVPSDVLTIIKEHHELPDGTGFPRGLNETNLSGLSLIFIAALRLADHIFFHGHSQDSLYRFLGKMRECKFDEGHSEKTFLVLQQVVQEAE